MERQSAEPITAEEIEYQKKVCAMQAALDKPVTVQTEHYISEEIELGVDIWRPNPEEYPGIRPGILYFFGGGFHLGTRKTYQKHCKELARQGYVAMTADYRIHSLFGTTAEAGYIDGANAWNFVYANASRWNLDPERIVLAGGSAGGMIAAMCSRLTGRKPFGLVLLCPGMLDADFGPERLSRLTGRKAAGIPVLNVAFPELGDPPMLVMHGAADDTVPVENVREFVRHAKQEGVSTVYVEIPDALHGFDAYCGSREYYFLSIGETLRFLNHLNTGKEE